MNEYVKKFCRNPEEIAGALGRRLHRQKKLRAAELAELREWSKRPDFPKKTKHGWPREQVVEWGISFAPELAAEKRQRAAVADIFNSSKPRKDSIAILDGGTAATLQRVRSQTQMAELISERFQVVCTKQVISDYLAGKRLPPDAAPFPPPRPGTSGEWDDAEIPLGWYQRYVVEPAAAECPQGELPLSRRALEAEQMQKIHEEQIEKFKLESLRKSDDKNFVTRQEMLNKLYAHARMVNGRIDALERSNPKLFAECPTLAGLPAEARERLLGELRAAQVTSNQRLKETLRHGAEEMVNAE